MKPWPSGANRNWPIEPAAVARPIAHERRSSGTSRAKAAMTIVNDPPERPRPMSTPPLSASVVPFVLADMSATPSAYAAPPAASTRPAPKRSATAPANGWPRPHSRFWIAIANANVSRSQPRRSDSGSVNSPKLVRVPNVMIAIRQPAAMTTVRRRHQGVVRMPAAPYHVRFNH